MGLFYIFPFCIIFFKTIRLYIKRLQMLRWGIAKKKKKKLGTTGLWIFWSSILDF